MIPVIITMSGAGIVISRSSFASVLVVVLVMKWRSYGMIIYAICATGRILLIIISPFLISFHQFYQSLSNRETNSCFGVHSAFTEKITNITKVVGGDVVKVVDYESVKVGYKVH